MEFIGSVIEGQIFVMEDGPNIEVVRKRPGSIIPCWNCDVEIPTREGYTSNVPKEIECPECGEVVGHNFTREFPLYFVRGYQIEE